MIPFRLHLFERKYGPKSASLNSQSYWIEISKNVKSFLKIPMSTVDDAYAAFSIVSTFCEAG